MESTALREGKKAVRVLADRLHNIFEEAGEARDFTKVKNLEGDTAAKIERVRAMNRELADAHAEVKRLEEIDGIAAQVQKDWDAEHKPAGGIVHPKDGERKAEVKSVGRLLVESPVFNEMRGRGSRQWPTINLPNLDIRNAVFQTGAGWDPEIIRIPRTELSPQRPIAVVDNVPMLPTDQSAINYMEETTFTNNAAETAESTATTGSDLIGEAALALTERTKPVEWLPVFLPVTMQQMEDVGGIQAYVDQRLQYMLRARLDLQILAGDGNTPNLEGTENVTGIQVQAKGGDTEEDAVFKAMIKVRDDGFAEPSVVFIRPAKFQNIRLRKTADGQYIWGHPSMPGPFTIWGVQMAQTTAVTSTKAILGDYVNFSALYTKRGITLAVSDSHAHYFTRGMLAIRADMRVAMVHFRPKAFAEVTGL